MEDVRKHGNCISSQSAEIADMARQIITAHKQNQIFSRQSYWGLAQNYNIRPERLRTILIRLLSSEDYEYFINIPIEKLKSNDPKRDIKTASQRDVEICQKINFDLESYRLDQNYKRIDLEEIGSFYGLGSTRIWQIVTELLGQALYVEWRKIPRFSPVVMKTSNKIQEESLKNEIMQTLYDYYERKIILVRPKLKELADKYGISEATARNMIGKLVGREDRVRWKKIPELNKKITKNNRRPIEIGRRAWQMIENFSQNKDFVRPILENLAVEYGITRERVRQILNEQLGPEGYERWKGIPSLNVHYMSEDQEVMIIKLIQSEIDDFFEGQIDHLSTNIELAERFHFPICQLKKFNQIDVSVYSKKHTRDMLLSMQVHKSLVQVRKVINLILGQMQQYDAGQIDLSELFNNSEISRRLHCCNNRLSIWTRCYLPDEVYQRRRTILSTRDLRARWLKYPNLEGEVIQYIQECITLYKKGEITQVPTPYELIEKYQCCKNTVYQILRIAPSGVYKELKEEYKRLTNRYRKVNL